MIKNNFVYAGVADVFQNGRRLSELLCTTQSEVTVEDRINEPAVFSIKFEIGDFIDQLHVEKVDVDQFQIGDEIQITMGFDQVIPMMVGEVCAIEPSFQDPFTLAIRGYDRLFRLTFGAKTVAYERQKDSELVSGIATNWGLCTKVEDTGIIYPYIFQNNQSDYHFLLQRAERIGFELLVDNKTLILRKPGENDAPVTSLSYGGGLNQFSMHMKTIPKDMKTETRSWNIDQKKEIAFSTSKGTQSVSSKNLFPGVGNNEISPVVINGAFINITEAEKVAVAEYDAVMQELVTGDGKCIGNPAVRSGVVLEINGIGKRFSGKYYVTSSLHTVNDEGYMTSFEVRKTGK